METPRGLFEKLISWENLVAAARAARRGKARRPDVDAFHERQEANLVALRAALAAGTWRPSGYREHWIYRPKRRKISCAPYPDRIVHHALVRVLEPIWERRFIFHSYACRVGKGTHRAVRAAQGFARRHSHVLKLDIRKYFPSVDHEVARAVVRRHVRDPRVLALFDRVIDGANEQERVLHWFPGDDLFTPVERRRGLPIGNLTSQFLGNVLLDELDHFVTDALGLGAYVRYMDDVLVFGDKTRLRAACARIRGLLAGLRLELNRPKVKMMPVASGFTFLGYRVFPSHLRITTTVKRRQQARLRALVRAAGRGTVGVADVRASLAGMLGHMKQADAWHLRGVRAGRVRFRFGGRGAGSGAASRA